MSQQLIEYCHSYLFCSGTKNTSLGLVSRLLVRITQQTQNRALCLCHLQQTGFIFFSHKRVNTKGSQSNTLVCLIGRHLEIQRLTLFNVKKTTYFSMKMVSAMVF